MDRAAKYSVLRYVPDIERQEFINLGVVLHYPDKQLLKMQTTEAFSRLRVFDDEIDLSFLELLLEGAKMEFNSESAEGPSRQDLRNPNLLTELTTRYMNQFQFSDIRSVVIKDFESDLNDLFRIYAYFEVPKSKRIDENKVRSVLSRTFREYEVSKFLKSAPTVKGKFEEIKMDFAYENMEYVKAFSFDYGQRQLSRAPDLARSWAFRFREVIEQREAEQCNSSDIPKPVFISVVHKKRESKHISTALEILRSESEVFYMDEVEKVARRFQKRIESDLGQSRLNLDQEDRI